MHRHWWRIFVNHAQNLKACQLLLLLLFTFCSIEASAQSHPLKIVVFGDSLTSGYNIDPRASFPIILERKLQSQGYQVNVINMSVAGETTTAGVRRLDSVINQAPDLVILEFGANDALSGLDFEKVTLQNLNLMIHKLRLKDIGVLLCGTRAPDHLSDKNKSYYTQIFYILAKKHKVTLYPDILKGVDKRPELTLADGLHPNENGVLAMVQQISPTIESLVKWRLKYIDYKKKLR